LADRRQPDKRQGEDRGAGAEIGHAPAPRGTGAQEEHDQRSRRADQPGPGVGQQQRGNQKHKGDDERAAAFGQPRNDDAHCLAPSEAAIGGFLDAVQHQADNAQQAEAGIGRIGIPVFESAGEIVDIAVLGEPEDRAAAAELHRQPVGRIGKSGKGHAAEYRKGIAARPARLKRDPEDARIGQKAQKNRARFVGHDGYAAGQALSENLPGAAPQRVVPGLRSQRRALHDHPEHENGEQADQGPYPAGADGKGRQRQGPSDAPGRQDQGGRYSHQGPCPRVNRCEWQRRNDDDRDEKSQQQFGSARFSVGILIPSCVIRQIQRHRVSDTSGRSGPESGASPFVCRLAEIPAGPVLPLGTALHPQGFSCPVDLSFSSAYCG
jgi:hypothetical protein